MTREKNQPMIFHKRRRVVGFRRNGTGKYTVRPEGRKSFAKGQLCVSAWSCRTGKRIKSSRKERTETRLTEMVVEGKRNLDAQIAFLCAGCTLSHGPRARTRVSSCAPPAPRGSLSHPDHDHPQASLPAYHVDRHSTPAVSSRTVEQCS